MYNIGQFSRHWTFAHNCGTEIVIMWRVWRNWQRIFDCLIFFWQSFKLLYIVVTALSNILLTSSKQPNLRIPNPQKLVNLVVRWREQDISWIPLYSGLYMEMIYRVYNISQFLHHGGISAHNCQMYKSLFYCFWRHWFKCLGTSFLVAQIIFIQTH